MTRKKRAFTPSRLQLTLAILGFSAFVAMSYLFGNSNTTSISYAETEQTFVTQTTSANGDVNEDGTSYQENGQIWIGNGASSSASYTAFRFPNTSLPKNAVITDAHIEVYSSTDQWIATSYNLSLAALDSTDKKPSQASLLPQSVSHSSNVKWTANTWYSLQNMSSLFQALVVREDWNGSGTVMVVLKGTGNAYARKFAASYDQSSGNAPKLIVKYKTDSTAPTLSPTSPSPTKAPTSVSVTITKAPTVTTTSATNTIAPSSPTLVHTNPVGGGSIYGVVSADLLGTCSQEIHDKYVVTGPDGVLYRTWHPQKDGSGCTFAHEHGDDPATSKIYSGPVAFNYVAKQAGMDEPHAGFKCFVHNAGTKNDEGGTALHSSYYCFHMGTGGAARFSARFHSLEFHVVTSKGAKMDIQGLADTGNVGTICNNPRQQRTVMGLGCKLDSAYEIWENRLNINNKGSVVATTITSTAVFDSITVMDPADKTKAIPVWDPIAQSGIFKFVNDRSGYRGCDREAYSGPLMWYNARGAQVYYTDVYGNVVDGGPLKQTVSLHNTNSAGETTQFGGLIMAYKGGSDPQTQFKYRKSTCGSGLGIKN
jgi:hypothetical protein